MPPKNNAFIQFTDVLKTHRDERSNKDVTVLAGHKPVLTGLTEDILLNGDLNTLLDFYDKNKDRMTEEEKQYMQIRIDSATEVSRLKQKAINDLAEGNVPQGPEPQKSEDGMIGFPDIKNPGVQTSSNGCWSMAYSLLLKSRGVDLSQERIRAWRPDQTKNPIPAELQNVASKESAIYRMNVDGGNTISENPDLVTQVLPNTALRSVKIDPLSYEILTLDGNPVTDQNDKDKIKANYIKQASMMLSSTVSNAINKDHSPVAITYHGHFLTITGISEDGKSVRLEDTQQANPNDRTSIVSIESIVTDAMSERILPNGENRAPTGFELNWLHDLKVPEFDKKNNQQIDIPEHDRMFMNPDTDGNLNIDVPSSYIQASNIGNPSAGQIEGKGVTISVVMDMNWLSQDLGGKKVESVISSDGNYTFGHSDTYYPNRVLYPKDPQIQANRQSETQLQDQTRMMLNEAGLNNNLNQSTPTQTTTQTPTQTTTQTPTQTTTQTTPQTTTQTTQVNQSQANQTNQTRQHQYSQEFINALHALKQSAQAEIDNAQTVQSMKAHLKTPFENLIKEIKKDPYIPAVIGDNNWEQNLKIGFEADPARYCLRTVDHLGNNLGINDQINVVQNNQRDNQRNNQRDNDPNAISNKIEARWNYLKENVDVKGKVSALGRKQMLAEIVALSELGARKRARGAQNPKVTDQELEEFTNRVMNDELFNRLIANGNDLNLARNGDTKKIIIGIGKVNDQLKKENNYAITKHIRLKQKRCKYIANRLEASLTGSYDGLGVIKRGSNSDGFEDALDAIREFSEMERPKGTDVYKAVQTVKDYLSDKMGTVVRGFGRERWGQCMLFLKETMPRKEFEEYCQQINKARGVENNPQSKKYISPEMFGFKKEPVSSILAETRDRILSGKGTERDYAVLITLRNRYDYFGTFDGSKTLEKETDRRRFIRDTERTLQSENFRRFITEINEAQRRALIQGDCDGLASYEENLPALEVDPNAATNTAQNTNKATTNIINTQNTNQPNQVHLTNPGATNNRTTNTPAGRSQTMVTTPQQSTPHM